MLRTIGSADKAWGSNERLTSGFCVHLGRHVGRKQTKHHAHDTMNASPRVLMMLWCLVATQDGIPG